MPFLRNYYITLLLLLTLFYFYGCSPYSDDDFFEPVKTNNYEFDAYQGDTGFELDSSYNINPNERTEINLESFDGQNTADIVAIFIGDTTKINENKIIVYCHDKMNNIDYYWPRLELLAKLGLEEYGILAVDYRGYGKSTGTPSESGLYADINAALVWLESNGLTSDRLIMYGYGLGSAVAIELTQNPRSLVPSKLIIESPLASIESLVQDTTLQATPSSYVTNLDFDNVSKMKNITQPLLWIHGTEDKVYPIDTQGSLVFNQHTGIKNVDKFEFRIVGASHYNVPEKFPNGVEGYRFDVLTFLSLP